MPAGTWGHNTREQGRVCWALAPSTGLGGRLGRTRLGTGALAVPAYSNPGTGPAGTKPRPREALTALLIKSQRPAWKKRMLPQPPKKKKKAAAEAVGASEP